jgi:hypothetical protein
MKYSKGMILLAVVGLVSCRDATAPRRLNVPNHAHFMQVEIDPTCDYVSTICPYTIGGVTVYGGGSDNPPPLIIWTDAAADPPSIYNWLPYPDDGNYAGYSGATVGTTSQWLPPGATIVEAACDPRPQKDPNCLLPLESRDSVFLTSVLADLSDCILYVKCADEMATQEMADQCEQMKLWLEDSIDQTFNRPPGNTTQGIFRGRNGVGSMDQTESVHGGATSNGAAHADEFEWQIYAADSLHQRRNLVNILMHESVHQHNYNHGPQGHENYASYPYFKYVISGSFHGCVRI